MNLEKRLRESLSLWHWPSREKALCKALIEVAEKWAAYDDAIRGRAKNGEYRRSDEINPRAALAEGADLDSLYFDATFALLKLRKKLDSDTESK